MKICLLIYHLDVGGVEKVAVDFVNELVSQGHEVTLHTIYKCKSNLFNLDKRVILKNTFGFYIKGINRIVSKIPAKILYRIFIGSKSDYDIEIAFQAELPTTIIANSYNALSKKIAWVHGLGMVYSEIYDVFAKVVFVSDSLKEHYMPLFKESSQKDLLVIYNPVDFRLIEQLSRENIENISQYKNKDDIVFITVGRLSPEKRFDRLIDSFKYCLDTSNKNLKLWIVGSGVLENELKQQAEKLGIAKDVIFMGFQDNPYKFMAESDIYVCSSDNEGFNVAMTEAASLSLPIVSTDVFGAHELLGNNDYGFVTERTTVALADAMLEMLETEIRYKFSSMINSRVLELFINDRAEQIKSLFD